MIYKITSAKYYDCTNGCGIVLIPPWGLDPMCFKCRYLDVVSEHPHPDEENMRLVIYAPAKCEFCHTRKDEDGLCMCNFMPVDGETQDHDG